MLSIYGTKTTTLVEVWPLGKKNLRQFCSEERYNDRTLSLARIRIDARMKTNSRTLTDQIFENAKTCTLFV